MLNKKLKRKVSTLLIGAMMISAMIPAASAAEEGGQVTSWKDLYSKMGVSTETGYDAVTSATKFTGYHAKDIPPLVHKDTDADGNTICLDGIALSGSTEQKAVSLADGYFSYSSRYGKGEFDIVPDDTVEGYVWNEYFSKLYAATISDGKTTVGALPWTDLYAEPATSGAHYNKVQIAVNNGTSVASNQAEITRYAAFFDENGNVKAGDYTVTVYAEGYAPLTAQIEVLQTYVGTAEAGDVCTESNCIAISGLPDDIKNPTVTVSYKVGEGRQAQTFYVAQNESLKKGKANIDALDELEGTALTVTVNSDNYAPITLDPITVQKHNEDGNCEYCAGNKGNFADVPADAYYADAVKWAVKKHITEGSSDTQFDPDNNCTRAEIVTFLWRAAGRPEPASDADTNAFADVDSSSYYSKAVQWAASEGITLGTSENEFSPDAECTRAEIVTFLWRYAGQPEAPADAHANAFADVDSDSFFADAVQWAAANDIVKGVSAGRFAPADTCTRAQAMTFIYRQLH